MKTRTSQSGITLLEIILILGIAASLIVFAIRIYNQFRYQTNEQKILASVNQLFQALNGYYSANCRMALDDNSNQQSTGKLDPLITDTSGIPASIVLTVSALQTLGVLTNWQALNPLVDNSAANQGYFIQFNRVLSGLNDPVTSISACTGSSKPPSCDVTNQATLTSSSSPPSAQSHLVTWTVQVSVKLAASLTPAQLNQIARDLSADCISTPAGGGIAPCKPVPTASGYLVWTRMPSAYNSDYTSEYWTSLPYVKQFNMQYTNDGMAALSNVKNETQNWYNPLYYLCGG